METIIEQILRLSGPMPDAAAHARYLATLSPAELQARAAALVESRPRPAEEVRFWQPNHKSLFGTKLNPAQTDLMIS